MNVTPKTDRSTSSLTARFVTRPVAIGALALIALAITLITLASLRSPTPTPGTVDTRQVVRVAQATTSAGQDRLRLPGVLRPSERGEQAFFHAGHLAERRVVRGQQVAAGEVLAVLHNPALMPGLSAAEARVGETREQLEQVEREVRRQQDLHQRDLVSTEELERITSRARALRQTLSEAEARRQEAREQLAEAELRAPYPATVAEVFAEPGEFLGAGQPVLELAGRGGLEVPLRLGAERAGQFRDGQTVSVRRVGTGATTSGRVREGGLASAGRAATVVVELDADPGPDWWPGQAVQVEWSSERADALSVPLSAIVDPAAGDAHLFRVIDGKALRINVRLGALDGDRVVVEGALADGDEVVVAGHSQLLDGETVRVLP